MIVPSTLISRETPAAKGELWDASSLFIANWISGVTVRSAYMTDVVASKSTTESRILRAGKPSRSVTFTVTAFDRDAMPIVQALMMRAGSARSIVPLYPDQAKLIEPAGQNLQCTSLTGRRYMPGGRCVIAKARSSSHFMTWTVCDITSINGDTITLAQAPGDFPAGSRVYPAIEGDLVLNSRVVAMTNEVLNGQLTFRETDGLSALDPTTAPGINPADFDTHNGLPIFDLITDWKSVATGVHRVGSTAAVGTGMYTEVYGARPYVVTESSFTAMSRETAARVIRFWDSRGGRCYPFWAMTPVSEFTVITQVGNVLYVKATGALIDWSYRPYIGVRYGDGRVIRKVTAYSRANDTDAITLDAPINLGGIKSVSSAYIMRFNTDEMIERWITDDKMTTSLSLIETDDRTVLTNVDTDIEDRNYGGDGDVGVEDEADLGDDDDPTNDPDGGDGNVDPFNLFKQFKFCRDNSDTGLWIRSADIPQYPFTVRGDVYDGPNKVGVACMYVGTETYTNAGVLVRSYTEVANCADASCNDDACWDCESVQLVPLNVTITGADSEDCDFFDGQYAITYDGTWHSPVPENLTGCADAQAYATIFCWQGSWWLSLIVPNCSCQRIWTQKACGELPKPTAWRFHRGVKADGNAGGGGVAVTEEV